MSFVIFSKITAISKIALCVVEVSLTNPTHLWYFYIFWRTVVPLSQGWCIFLNNECRYLLKPSHIGECSWSLPFVTFGTHLLITLNGWNSSNNWVRRRFWQPTAFFFFSPSYATPFHVDVKARFINECTISSDIHICLSLILLPCFWGQKGSFLNWDQQNNLFF